MSLKSTATDEMWRAYTLRCGAEPVGHVVVAFGDSPEMATELAQLVVVGRKRATCSLYRDYVDAPDTLPKVGDHVVVVDGDGVPRCIWRTTEVVIKPLIEVDDLFAWDEGEGDRTRRWWLEAHRGYFARQAANQGFEMRDQIEAVFERIVVVWPEDVADT